MLVRMALPRPVPAAADVAYREWRPPLWALMVIAASIGGLSLGVLFSVVYERGYLAQYEYHLWKWEGRTLLDNAFARAGIGPDPTDTEGATSVRQYFALTSSLRAQTESVEPNLALIDTLASERAAYENDVERLLERYITEVVESAALDRRLPLFSRVRITWPPVDFELTSPPRLLVRSPRGEIQRSGETLLQNDLTLRQIESIEERTDDEDTVSLVVAIGGLAAYPAIVRDDRSYDSLLETASHEWVHHYLAFYPLGRTWGTGGDSLTLNETTANIAGREIAALIRKTHPIQLPEDADGRAPAGPAPLVDFNVEMRALRLEVDALLAEARVEEAERAMEEKRLFLAENGIAIRKLNQAYFAFYGTYGDSAASSNPIGPKVEEVWEETRNLGLFLEVMREVASVADLDEALGKLQGP